jgi:hypothetical protein
MPGGCRLGGKSPSSLLTGLVAYWKLDGNSNDALGSFHGTDTSITYGAGKINSGAYGQTYPPSIIDLPNIAALSGGTPRTISMWVKMASTSQRGLWRSGWMSQNSGTLFMTQCSVYLPGDVYVSFWNDDYVTAGGVLGTGSFTHLTVTYDGGLISVSTVHVYADGVAQALTQVSIPAPEIAATYNQSFAIGKNIFGYQSMDGCIDEVGAWNRSLSAPEVTALYNAGAGIQYPF